MFHCQEYFSLKRCKEQGQNILFGFCKRQFHYDFASQENTLKGNSFNDMNSRPQFSQVNRKAC